MARRKKNPIDDYEAQVRAELEKAVNVFGFVGVLDLLADEASERADADTDDESAQLIVDGIEAAIEEISDCESEEEETDDDEEDGDEEDGDEEDGE